MGMGEAGGGRSIDAGRLIGMQDEGLKSVREAAGQGRADPRMRAG